MSVYELIRRDGLLLAYMGWGPTETASRSVVLCCLASFRSTADIMHLAMLAWISC